MTITVSTTDRRSVQALQLLAGAGQWARVTLKTGEKFFAVPSSKAVVSYLANNERCECPDHAHRQVECKHIIACRLFTTRAKAKPKPAPRYQDLYGTDGDDSPPVKQPTRLVGRVLA